MITIEAYRARIGCFFVKHHRGTQPQKSQSSFETDCCGWNTFFHIWIFLFILTTLSININMALLKVSLLLLGGDIESNPGPPVTGKIQKFVLGTFHQGHAKFGDTAGIQCSCNALYAICFSIVKKVSIWKSYDLDYILDKGDKTFKLLGISRPLFMCELPRNIMIENTVIEVDMLGNYFGLLVKDNIFENNASVRETGNGLIFMTGGFTISLIWSKNSVFLFDSHSRDGNGTFTSNGNSIVLSFKSLIDVNCYIKMEYSKHLSNFHEQQYELQYVRVRAKDNTSACRYYYKE